MAKKKKSILRWLFPLVLLLALAAVIVFVYVPIYSRSDDAVARNIEFYGFTGSESSYTLENDDLIFTLDAETTQFTVTNKQTGYVWHSNPVGADQDGAAVSSEKEKLKSQFVLTYASSDGAANTFNNYQYSVANGVYDVEAVGDEIRVHYTVGKISRTYYVPTAITKARMDMFTKDAGMTKREVSNVTNMFKLYDPAKLKAGERDELLATYPDLANEPVYVMLPKQKDNAKAKIEKLLRDHGYTTQDYMDDMARINSEETATGSAFNVTLCYRLEGNDLVVEVPMESIRYDVNYPINTLQLLPFMGASGAQEEGFMLVPEGSGALIRYNNGKIPQTAYSTAIYGWDYGSDRTVLVSEPRSAYPVFGMTGGENSFICILEDGASYASIKADISGRVNSYNSVNATYTVLHRDMYQVSAKTTQRIFISEKQVPQGCMRQRYRFLNSDSYVDMAAAYGDYLRQQFGWQKNGSTDAPIEINLLGAIEKTVKRLGLPISSDVAVTGFERAGEMIAELNGAGLNGLHIRYEGWANGGVNQKVLTRVKPVNVLGGEKKLLAFLDSARQAGNTVYLDGVSEFAYRSGIFEGFNAYTDAAKYTTRERVKLHPFSSIFFTPLQFEEPFYLVKPAYMLRMTKNLSDKAAELGAGGVSYRDVGYLLSADYDPKNLTTREASLQLQKEALAYAREKGQKTMIRAGNAYAMGLADLVTDLDITGGGYSILDERVPFLPIAVHGYLEYTAEPMNRTGDPETLLLRSAEYGAGLSYTFMDAAADMLVDTNYTAYVSTVWDAWKDEAMETLLRYRADMAGLNDQRIVDHAYLSDTLTCTVFENGTKIYVNYGFKDAAAEGSTVPARSYLVKGGAEQ